MKQGKSISELEGLGAKILEMDMRRWNSIARADMAMAA